MWSSERDFRCTRQDDRDLFRNNSESSDKAKPLSKVLKRVYGEGGSSEGNVGMSEKRVFQKEFWDFLRAGAQSVILKED